MDIDIISLFPQYFSGPFEESMIKRARQKKLLNIALIPLRDFSEGRHQKVDERPFGGGPGMVLMPGPAARAIRSVRRPNSHVVFLSPQGSLLTQSKCEELSRRPHLILLCGNYEGIDERIIQKEVDEEMSIGDFILTNGALPAIVLVDAVARHVPGVLGNENGVWDESFHEGIFEGPHYTHPREFEGESVPDVLLEGDHKKISSWRRVKALEKTKKNRPDLYLHYLSQSNDLNDDGKEVEGEVEFTLEVKNIVKSLNFFRKELGFNLLKKDSRRAVLSIGRKRMHLVEASCEVKPSPVFQIALGSKEKFFQIAGRIVHSRRQIGTLETKQTKQQLAFTDIDGYHWMLVHHLEEKQS